MGNDTIGVSNWPHAFISGQHQLHGHFTRAR
jgi:hypothetical protein